jgi:hypothetical protein
MSFPPDRVCLVQVGKFVNSSLLLPCPNSHAQAFYGGILGIHPCDAVVSFLLCWRRQNESVLGQLSHDLALLIAQHVHASVTQYQNVLARKEIVDIWKKLKLSNLHAKKLYVEQVMSLEMLHLTNFDVLEEEMNVGLGISRNGVCRVELRSNRIFSFFPIKDIIGCKHDQSFLTISTVENPFFYSCTSVQSKDICELIHGYIRLWKCQ